MIEVAMVSPLPAVPEANPESGVAGYTLSLVRHLPATVKTEVIAQRSAERLVSSPHVDVSRSWRPGFFAAKDIVSAVSNNDAALIHLQHEFRLFGGILPTAAVVELLHRSRRIRVPVVTTLHGVVPLSEINSDFLRRYEVSVSPALARKAFRSALASVKRLSAATVVHHSYFKEILAADYGFDESSIEVIVPGIPGVVESVIDSASLGTRPTEQRPVQHVLVFGFLTSYKLPELLVDVAVLMKDAPIHFTFCISENPRASSGPYRDRYLALRDSVLALHGRASWSGYIPDVEVPRLFSDADLLVLPYVDCISVSAVASLAISHGVKICHSAPLSRLFLSSDLEFELTPTSLAAAITKGLESDHVGAENEPNLITWNESATQTALLWQDVLSSRAPNR